MELVDLYENPTRTLTPTDIKLITVDAVGLDKPSVKLRWQVRIKRYRDLTLKSKIFCLLNPVLLTSVSPISNPNDKKKIIQGAW